MIIFYSETHQEMIDQRMKSGGKMAVKPYRPDPIRTRYVGTIAFQGTDAQIIEAMQRYFGGVK